MCDWKLGDKIRCIDPRYELKLGEVYTVFEVIPYKTATDSKMVIVVEAATFRCDSSWFELVPPKRNYSRSKFNKLLESL